MNYIYLDNAATTKVNAQAFSNAVEYFNQSGFYNPSALYEPARLVKKRIDEVRCDILSIFSSNYDVVFTSGGTEADNLACFSFGKRGNIITTAGEHSAIYNTFNQLKQLGAEPRFAKLNADGSVDEQSLLSLVDEKTTFVSVVHVNNETGAINDINRLAKLVKTKNKNVIFHSDGVQAFLKIPYRLSSDIDLYSISAHKIEAIKGTGALIYKKSLHIKAMLFGGGQEKNIRSGTENTLGIFVFGNAVKLNSPTLKANYEYVKELKTLMMKKLEDVSQFVSSENSSPYILSLSFPGIKAEILQRVLENSGVIVGTGSACSAKLGTSRIINNCGLDKKVGEGVIRLSFIYSTTKEEILTASEIIKTNVQKLRMALK